MTLLVDIGRVWHQYRAFHAALAELNGYSDRELGELGLARSDVVRTAFAEAERRAALAMTPAGGRPAAAAAPTAAWRNATGPLPGW